MESLGLLAGGVAHDCNNLLTVIVGDTGRARLALQKPFEIRTLLDRLRLFLG